MAESLEEKRYRGDIELIARRLAGSNGIIGREGPRGIQGPPGAYTPWTAE